MKRSINKFLIQQIIFFIIFLTISIFFGAGGDGAYIPFAIFFGPFAIPIVLLQLIPESIRIENGSFFIMISSLIDTFFILIQPLFEKRGQATFFREKGPGYFFQTLLHLTQKILKFLIEISFSNYIVFSRTVFLPYFKFLY